MKKFGFFGGCFNPVTKAHIGLIKEVIEKNKLDKVYFVPMGDLYEKRDLIPLNDRMEMLKIAFRDEEKMDILNISNTEQKMYAIDTFKRIDQMFPEVERYFIMGSDNYQKMITWKNAEELRKKYAYIVLDREKGYTQKISSSGVRTKIKLEENVNHLLLTPVIEYIQQKKLYK